MGTLLNVIQEWYTDDNGKDGLYKQIPELVIRWINEGQLRYADKSEVLQGIWSPTITSTGSIALPTDFLREVQNRVKYDSNTVLRNIPYADAINISAFGGTYYYSIWDGTFYVWAAAACTPTIPYIVKPATLTSATVATADLEMPTEDQTLLILYLDARYARKQGNTVQYMQLMDIFDQKSRDAGQKFRERRDPVPIMRSSRW